MSPQRLVDTFPPPHDDIHTLYDNLESTIAQFPDVREGGRLAQLLMGQA